MIANDFFELMSWRTHNSSISLKCSPTYFQVNFCYLPMKPKTKPHCSTVSFKARQFKLCTDVIFMKFFLCYLHFEKK